MTFVQVDSRVSLADRPRRLTAAEISDTLNGLRFIDSPFSRAAALMHSELRQHVGSALEEIDLCPSMIADLQKIVISTQYTNSCQPGYPIGLDIGSALGSINTQTMLNTFKVAGAADTGSRGVEASENLVYARPSPSTDYTSVHLLNKQTSIGDALRISLEIDTFTAKDAVTSYAIHDLPLRQDPGPWFGIASTGSFRLMLQQCACILELLFDPDRLLEKDLTTFHIAETLSASDLQCVWSSTSEGKVWVLPNFHANLPESQRRSRATMRCFYKNLIQLNLHLFQLKGVQGMSKSMPVIIRYTTFIKDVRPLRSDMIDYRAASEDLSDFKSDWGSYFQISESEQFQWTDPLARAEQTAGDTQLWRVVVDMPSMLYNNIPLRDLIRCMHIAEIRDIRRRRIRAWATMPVTNDNREIVLTCKSNVAPDQLMESCFAHFQGDPETKYSNPFIYVYLKTKGINLAGLMQHPSVDPCAIVTVNAQAMAAFFGIDTARNSHMKVITETFNQTGTGLHPAKIKTMCDHLTSTGNVHGVDHTGMGKRGEGFLTRACLERSSRILTQSALNGMYESTKNLAPAIVMGGTSAVGTGLNSVLWTTDDGTSLVDEQIEEHCIKSTVRPDPIIEMWVPPLDAWIPPSPTADGGASLRDESAVLSERAEQYLSKGSLPIGVDVDILNVNPSMTDHGLSELSRFVEKHDALPEQGIQLAPSTILSRVAMGTDPSQAHAVSTARPSRSHIYQDTVLEEGRSVMQRPSSMMPTLEQLANYAGAGRDAFHSDRSNDLSSTDAVPYVRDTLHIPAHAGDEDREQSVTARSSTHQDNRSESTCLPSLADLEGEGAVDPFDYRTTSYNQLLADISRYQL